MPRIVKGPSIRWIHHSFLISETSEWIGFIVAFDDYIWGEKSDEFIPDQGGLGRINTGAGGLGTLILTSCYSRRAKAIFIDTTPTWAFARKMVQLTGLGEKLQKGLIDSPCTVDDIPANTILSKTEVRCITNWHTHSQASVASLSDLS